MHFNYNFVKLNFLQPVLHPLEIILICWFGAYKNRIIINVENSWAVDEAELHSQVC